MSIRATAVAVALVATILVLPAAAGAQPFQSDNVQLITKLPEAVGAIGARFSPNGNTMYVTSAHGLGIYDVSKPDDPQRLSRLPLPHFENEDVDVGHVAGKDIVVITNDPSFSGVGIVYIIDVTDPTLPSPLAVEPVETLINSVAGTPGSSNGHIANCIQNCKYLWTTGSSEGLTVFDLTDPSAPKYLGAFQMPVPKGGKSPGFTHDVFVDRSGIAWVTGEDGTFGFDTVNMPNPLKPALIYRSDENVTNTGNSGPDLSPGDPSDDSAANAGPLDFLHHNSIRTDIQLAPKAVPPAAPASDSGQAPVPSASPESGATVQPASAAATKRALAKRKAVLKKRNAKRVAACKRIKREAKRSACLRHAKRVAAAERKALTRRRALAQRLALARPRTTFGGLGDVVAVTEEDYLRPGCNGQGSLQTWQITDEKNSDGTVKLKMLDQWTTELNELAEMKGRSNPDGAPTTVNCSAHWFDESDGLIAQGWYDQGIRFMDIRDPRNIKQAGYYVTQGSFWAAYYAPSDPKQQIVYALDTVGGIDVLKFDRDAPAGGATGLHMSKAATEALLARAPKTRPSKTWGYVCSLVQLS